MKKIIYVAILAFVVSCSPSKSELYAITDSFVESLATNIETYGMFGSEEDTKVSKDGLYQVMPMGRLINVKILKEVSNEEYKELEADLESHYKNDKRVNDIYISNGGTVMIDCRN